MGAWGTGSFENDAAVDWLNELEHSDGLNPVTEALAFVANLDLDEYLEVDEASAAVAAAEIVAALHGHPTYNLPERAQEWLAAHRFEVARDPVNLAVKAVSRVKADSELKELWDESPDVSDWFAKIDDLLDRLNQTHQ